MKSRISVVLAAYHGEKYIGEQLKSLFKQTRIPDEILIGDDSSDDKTFQALEAVRPLYSGELKYFRNTPRLGVVQNFVHLAKAATGDFIFFCDQDDVWLPEKIEKLAAILEQDANCQVAVCNSFMVDKKLNYYQESLLSYAEKYIFESQTAKILFKNILYQRINFSGHNMVMKKTFKDIFLRIPPAYRFHDLWLAQTAALLNVITYNAQKLTLYRIHDKNVSVPIFQKVRSSIFHRFSEVSACSDDFEQTVLMLNGLSSLASDLQEIPFDNMDILTQCSNYFHAHKHLRSFPRPFRFLALTPTLMRDYFLLGTGWKAFLRDQLF